MNSTDKTILRDLTKEYLEICQTEEQDKRRDLWRKHNSFKRTHPPIYVRAFAWSEMPQSRCKCEDPFFRYYEDFFRNMLFRETLDDDFIFEPWVTVEATYGVHEDRVWGLPIKWIESPDPRGAKRMDPPIKNPEDAERMVQPHHTIDEADTDRKVSKLQ